MHLPNGFANGAMGGLSMSIALSLVTRGCIKYMPSGFLTGVIGLDFSLLKTSPHHSSSFNVNVPTNLWYVRLYLPSGVIGTIAGLVLVRLCCRLSPWVRPSNHLYILIKWLNSWHVTCHIVLRQSIFGSFGFVFKTWQLCVWWWWRSVYMSLKVRATFLLVVFSPSVPPPSPPLSPLNIKICQIW